ncbi:MAG TPA: VOC family protein [Sphingomicrobium sp.]|nr:VOC family protein [Sphingomicrobium sp.]
MSEARIDYVELPSATAHELTRAFYAAAFGWTFTNYGPDYSATTSGDVDLGLEGSREDALSAPLAVIHVGDLEAALDAVCKANGIIARPIYSFPGGRRFHFIDPGGNELAVWSDAGITAEGAATDGE